MDAEAQLELLRYGWVLVNLIGAIFFVLLLAKAVGDLVYRKGVRQPLRSGVLLGWQRVALDGVLGAVLTLNVVLAAVSFTPGNGIFIIGGLVCASLLEVGLGIYLYYNRKWVEAAYKDETKELQL